MKDRIRQLMEAQNMTQQTFANFIGISPATLSGILSERTKPTLGTVEAINNKFPNISLDWLMFGKGPMFQEEDNGENLSSTPQDGGATIEQALDFGGDGMQPDLFSGAAAHGTAIPTATNRADGQSQPRRGVRTDVVYKESEPRKITEIRVFYDDQTWECFVPKK